MPDQQQEFFKKQVMEAVGNYYSHVFKQKPLFETGNRIPYSGRVFDEKEIFNLIDASLEFWLTSGRYTMEFEKKLADFLNVKYCAFVNSGSSANLLAFMALTSPKLGHRQIQPDDEIITVAAGFPTTVTPIIQYGAVPVFLDVTIPEYNVDISQLEEALSPKTKAVMLAHTLGNPFNIKSIKQFCEKYSLWLIEDNCDALGSKYYIDDKWQYTGTIGDIGTSSFYPPHHMTTGEGGAVYTNNALLHEIVCSLRDWGRDCKCPPGQDNLCGCRFDKQYGELPFGYDHKYVYSHFGYNLKATDLQASIGCAQLDKLEDFIQKRKDNWQNLFEGLKPLEKYFELPVAEKNTNPSWFGFVITVKDDAPFIREDIVRYLELKNIQTRMLFAGNIIKHPCFDELRKNNQGYRVIGDLINTEKVLNRTFWIGVYPGLTQEMLDWVILKIKEFVNSHDRKNRKDCHSRMLDYSFKKISG